MVQVDPRDMLNNFCYHAYAQKSLVYRRKWQCFFLDTITRAPDIRVHRAGSQLKNKMVQVDPRDMLNNFCFHVYAQKSLFIGEIGNEFFWTASSSAPVPLPFIELVPS